MTLPNQFVNWRLATIPGRPKPIKLPCFPDGYSKHGEIKFNHMDPANWLSEEQARATGLDVGFVFTADDPYFLIDLDGQRDPVSGQWSEYANHVVGLFPGALMEVSQSGNGLHIIASCNQSIIADKWNKWSSRLGGPQDTEFYGNSRFVAMSRFGYQGNPHLDFTATLQTWVPARPPVDMALLTGTGPSPDWDGPTDDETLIGMMLASKGSVAVKFGDKASFRDLWTGNVEALAKHFPPSGLGDFDHSTADAALCAHLAFWTGRDIARMDRLFRRSALYRPKWDRASYRAETASGAARKSLAVYKRPVQGQTTGDAAAPLQVPPGATPAPPMTTGGTLPVTGLPPGPVAAGGAEPLGYLSTGDMARVFKGCVYIEALHQVLTPDGTILDPKRFNVRFGGFEFQMQADGARPSREPFEAFTANRCMTFPKARSIRYVPSVPFGAMIGPDVNVLRLAPGARSDADVGPFLDLLQRVMPVQRDREIYLAWCAAMVQYPGIKFQWATVLQGAEGNGKTFFLRCLQHAVGTDLTHLPNPEDMHEKYNTYLEGNLLIGVEEIHMDGKRELLDRLKKYITNDQIEIRGMNSDKRMTDNLANWLFLTNFRDAVTKTKGDRRYAIFYLAQQYPNDLKRDGLDGGYFPRLYAWARSGGYEAVAGYLARYAIPNELNPATECHRAPETSSTEAAVEITRSPLELEINDAIGGGLPGFKGGWISSTRLFDALRQSSLRHVSRAAVRNVLEQMGYTPFRKFPDGRSPVHIMQENGSRPTLYCTAAIQEKSAGIENYLVAQGYEAPKLTVVPSFVIPSVILPS